MKNVKIKTEIKKSPIDMNYSELEILLDSLLEYENLQSDINYRNKNINYNRKKIFWVFLKAIYQLVRAEIFYLTYIRKRMVGLFIAPLLVR